MMRRLVCTLKGVNPQTMGCPQPSRCLAIILGLVVLTGWPSTSWAGWWDKDYFYRSRLTVNAGSGPDIPADYTAEVDLDHAALVSQGKALPNGQDVRVIYEGGISTCTPSAPCELPRIVEDETARAIWHLDEPKLGQALDYGDGTGPLGDPDGLPAPPGLIAHFSFDVDGFQSSEWPLPAPSGTNVSDGKLAPSTTTILASESVPGKFGKAFSSTSSNWVQFANDPDLAPASLTIEVWVYPTASGMVLERCGGGGGSCSYQLEIVGDRVVWRVRPSGLATQSIQDDTALELNRWHHLVGMYSNTAPCEFRLYVDGRLGSQEEVSPCAALSSSTADFYIGHGNGGTEAGFIGLVDDLAIWSRTLSDTEILDHWSRGASKDAAAYVHTVGLHRAGGVSGRFGQGLNFAPAQTAAAVISDSVWLDPTGDFTIEFFFFPRANASAGLVRQWGATASDMSWSFQQTPGAVAVGPKVKFQVNTNPTTASISTLSATTDVFLNSWHHVAATRAGTTYSLYVDGVLQGSPAVVAGTPVDSPQQPIILGADSVKFTTGSGMGQGQPNLFDGRLDEVAFHTRALSAAELQSHAANGVPGTGWNSDKTRIRFKLQRAITADSNDSSYFVYYGNPVAGSTLEGAATAVDSKDRVYLFYDDFNSLDTAKWQQFPDRLDPGGTLAYGAGYHYLRGAMSAGFGWGAGDAEESNRTAVPPLVFDSATELQFRLMTSAQPSNTYFGYRDVLTDNAVGMQSMPPDASLYTEKAGAALELNMGTAMLRSFHVYTIRRNGATNATISVDGGTPTEQTSFTFLPTTNLPITFRPNSTSGYLFDWLLVRGYVPGKTFPLGTVDLASEQVLLWLDSGSGQYIGAGSTQGANTITFQTTGGQSNSPDPGKAPSATSDLRITIPSSLIPLKWDTSVGTITPGGPQAAKISTTLLPYENAGRTAVVDVISDFVGGNQVTIGGLRFDARTVTVLHLPSDPVEARLGADTNNDGTIDVSDAWLLFIKEGLSLLDMQTVGQVSNMFQGATAPFTNLLLHRFRLQATGGNVAVKQLIFRLSVDPGNTIVFPTAPELYLDVNGNGLYDVGTDTIVGTTGTVDTTARTVTFGDGSTTVLTVSGGGGANYLLVGDFATLANGNALTVALAAGDLTSLGVTSTQSVGAIGTTTNAAHSKVAYTITVSGPGYPTLLVGSAATISWTRVGNPPPGSTVTLQYTTDGTAWPTIPGKANLADDGSEAWTVTDAVSTTAQVRVVNDTDTRIKGESSPFTITGTLAVSAPAAGLHWPRSDSRSITWTSNPGSPTISLVKLEVGTAASPGGPYTYTTIAAATANDGSEFWMPSSLLPAGADYAVIRITDVTAGASRPTIQAQSGEFAITQVTVTVPNGSEQWLIGSLQTITWTSSRGLFTDVLIEYSTDGGGLYQPIAETMGAPNDGIVPNTGSFVWTVPPPASTNVLVRISDANPSGLAAQDASDLLFTVAAKIDLVGIDTLSLPGGDTWVIGKTHTISWQQVGNFDVYVELLKDGSWSQIGPRQSVTTWVPGGGPVSVSMTYQSQVTDENGAAKVRIIPAALPLTAVLGSGESGTFLIKPAFFSISPSGKSILAGPPGTTISWSTLAGYSAPFILIAALGPDPGGLPPPTTWIPNTSPRSWTPTTSATGVKLRLCDANQPAVCGESQQPFNVVQITVSLLNPKSDYTVGETMEIHWTGAETISSVRLLFIPNDGSPAEIDILSGGTLPGAMNPDQSGDFGWLIPDTLAFPESGVVRVQDADATNSAVGGNTPTAVTLHGFLSFADPSAAPKATDRWLIGSSPTIAWRGTGNMQVKLEWATAAGGPFFAVDNTVATPINSVTGLNTYPWSSVPVTAKSATAFIRVTDASDAGVTATSPSPGFHVIGQFNVSQPASGDYPLDAQVPIPIEWTTGPAGVVISPVVLRVVDGASRNVFGPINVDSPGSLTTYTGWTPTETGKDLRAEICDQRDATVCSSSSLFNVSGISVSTDAASYTMTPAGASITVQWRPVGTSGNFRAYYQVNGIIQGQIPDSTTTFTSNENEPNTFPWVLPPSFVDLSDKLQVVVTNVAGTISGTSAPPGFTVRGAFANIALSPAKAEYAVEDPVTINWDTIGQINAVTLWWSIDPAETCAVVPAPGSPKLIPVGANTPNGPTSVPWSIPLDAVSKNLRFCLADAVQGHAPTTAMSSPFIVGAKLAFQGLVNGDNLAVGTAHNLTWTTVGSVGQVLIEYGTTSGGVFTALGTVNDGPLADSGIGTTTIRWTVPDIPALVCPTQGGCPQLQGGVWQGPWTVPVKLQIRDETGPDHPKVPQVSQETLNAHYYHVKWLIQNEKGTGIIDGVTVVDSSGFTVANDGWMPTLDPFTDQLGLFWFYKYKAESYTTQAAKANHQPDDRDWVADGHKTITLTLVSDVGATIPIRVNTAHQYDPVTKQVTIHAWLEERGQLGTLNLLGPGPATVKIYNGNTLLADLSDTTYDDPAGQYTFIWDATGVAPGIYFARATIERLSKPITSGGAFNIDLTSGGGGGAAIGDISTELTNQLKPIKDVVGSAVGVIAGTQLNLVNAVNDIHAATVGDPLNPTDSKLDQVHNELTGTGGATPTVRDLVTQTNTEVTGLAPDGTPLANSLKGRVIAIMEGEGAPDGFSGLRQLQDDLNARDKVMLERLPGGQILNRETSVEQGGRMTIQFKTKPGLSIPPSLQIFDPANDMLPGLPQPMAERTPGSGLYELSVTFDPLAAEGEYTVIAQIQDQFELPGGAMDSIVVQVTKQLARQATVSGVLSSLTDTLTSIDSRLRLYEEVMRDLKPLATATKDNAAELIADLELLSRDWATTPNTETLLEKLASLSTRIGIPQLVADNTTLAALSRSASDRTQDLKLAMGADTLIARGETLEFMTGQARTAAGSAATAAGTAATAASNAQTAATTAATAANAAASSATDAATRADDLKLAMGADTLIAASQTLHGNLANFRTAFNTLAGTQGVNMDTVKTRFDTLDNLINGLPATQVADQTAKLQAITDQLNGLEKDLNALSGAGTVSVDTLLAQLTTLSATVEGLKTSGSDTLLTQIAEVKKIVESAQGSSAAVGLAQGAYSAASEAVKILQQLQTEIRTNGPGSAAAPVLLGQFGDQLTKVTQGVSQTVTVFPDQSGEEELAEQLKKLAEQAKGIASDKGYHFDSLYELSETQASDVKTMRNHVEELKALLEVQRSILEQNMNQPVVKTWFEAR